MISKSLKLQQEIDELPKEYEVEIKEFDLPVVDGKRYIVKINKRCVS